jgi:hypothetical protein
MELECYKITLENGDEVICSENHRMFTKDNEKLNEIYVKNIKVGDELVVSSICPVCKKPVFKKEVVRATYPKTSYKSIADVYNIINDCLVAVSGVFHDKSDKLLLTPQQKSIFMGEFYIEFKKQLVSTVLVEATKTGVQDSISIAKYSLDLLGKGGKLDKALTYAKKIADANFCKNSLLDVVAKTST